MLLAAADFAEGKKVADRKVQAPPELLRAFQWQSFGFVIPPEEMPAGSLKRMLACLNVYTAISERNAFLYSGKKNATDSEFRKQYPQLASICRDVKELRDQYG